MKPGDKSDKVAQDAIDVLAFGYERARDLGAANVGNITRFTPSIKFGRRYLTVEIDGVPYGFTLEVERGGES